MLNGDISAVANHYKNGYHGLSLAPEGTFYGEDKNLTDPSGAQPVNGALKPESLHCYEN